MLLQALFAGNCVRVGETLKVPRCWPGTGVFWGGQLWGGGCVHYLVLPLGACGCWYRGRGDVLGTYSVTGLVPGTRTGSWSFRLPLGRRVTLVRCPVLLGRFASGFLTLDTSSFASGQIRHSAKFRDCQTCGVKSSESEVRSLDSNAGFIPWLVRVFIKNIRSI